MSKIKPEVAKRRIEFFEKRFGKAHLYLAYHAAFPLSLTPDLLYRLWANFQRDIHGEVLGIPWVAVADLLLSSLCDEVGHELYEMDLTVRNLLLSRLKEDEKFGQQRIHEISEFLLNYVQQQLLSDDPDIRDFAQAQQWVALAYTRPSEAASKLALAFSKVDEKDTPELVRMASLTETFAEPLVEFQPLLIYARGMGNFARGNLGAATTELSQVLEGRNQIQVAGVSLRIPKKIKINFQQEKVAHPVRIKTFEKLVRRGTSLAFINLKNADLSGAYFRNADLKNADLSGACLRDADLGNVNLRDANLSSADLSDAYLGNADLSNTDLRYANLDANLRYANLSGADLRYANLSGADLRYANLSGADLSSAHLRYANLNGTNLSYSDLRYANLSSANLRYANLSSANLSSANLKNAYLRLADLSGANLNSADLRSTDLSHTALDDANLSGANISDNQNLTFEQVKSCKNWEQALYDLEFRRTLGLK